MTAKEKINALIEAVKAGETPIGQTELTMKTLWRRSLVLAASDGNMDAAIYLQLELLPGWWWRAGTGKRQDPSASVWTDGVGEYSADAETPARALLLAILMAWKDLI